MSSTRKKQLQEAKNNKKDEFYTQLTDIEKEMKHYKDHFKGKVIYCNCDDPYESNFFQYFALNFNHLGLKKLITTSYIDSHFANSLFKFRNKNSEHEKTPYAIEINEVKDLNGDGAIDMADVDILLQNDTNTSHALKGDGSYDSDECLEFLKKSDIIVTNPPFSKFRSYFKTLMEYKKDFIILGNLNSVSCNDLRPYVIDNKVWFGPSISSGDRWFQVPDNYELTAANSKIENGKKFVKVKSIRWFTNLSHSKRNEEIILYQKYSPDIHPKYDNYDAIEVGQVKDIPKNYSGEMGVPITFLDKWNPDQFKIIGFDLDLPRIQEKQGDKPNDRFYINDARKYVRIVIKNKNPQ